MKEYTAVELFPNEIDPALLEALTAQAEARIAACKFRDELVKSGSLTKKVCYDSTQTKSLTNFRSSDD